MNQNTPIAQPPKTAWRTAFRIVRWTTYAAAIISLLLVLHKKPPPLVETSPQAAARAEQKIQQTDQAVAAGQSTTLRIDEMELNSYFAAHLNLAGNGGAGTPAGQPDVESVRSSVRDVKIELLSDRVRAYVVFDMLGKDLSLQIEGKLHAACGHILFEPVAGEIGSFPIPRSALDSAVRRMMESPENREKFKLPDEVSDIRIENGEVVLSYR